MAGNPREQMIERTRRAACAVASELGLTIDSAEVIAFQSSVILRLMPHNLIARVSGEAARIRPGADGRAREIEVTQYLAAAGAPVVSPSKLIDPGPHHRDGLTVTFWEYAAESDRPKSEAAALATLRACHDALKTYPGPLPYLQGYNETRKLFHELWQNDDLGVIDPGDTVQRLAAIDAVLADKGFDGDPANVPLHGDAHLGNMLVTDDRPDGTGLWIGWEDVSRGPVEWDYACLIVSLRDDPSRSAVEVAMMADIAGETDRDCLEALIDARILQRELWDTGIKVLHLREGPRRGLASRGLNFLSRKLQRR
jgi:aminoglycoside phosphotransferase (APT) family kinase protein